MLLDSNIIIYAAYPNQGAIRQFIRDNAPFVSIISYVEVLGYHRLTDEARQFFVEFFETSEMLPLTDEIAIQAVELRQQRRMTLGDSLIAGTVIVNNLTLVTHNRQDLEWISGLSLHDPLDLQNEEA
ncbi:type II toxin-antitoxin system VapC family toxin [Egbenema bharatensis]|uniref:type II toxin-antitoxin system VapC family toxin n=1 Tax=Egbenema bharatensis TaxID=3463334 RepID=UPI003A8ABE1A